MSAKLATAYDQSFPSQGMILDRAGLRMDATGWQWELNSAGERLYLRWNDFPKCSPEIMEATARYFARMVKTKSPSAVYGTFEALLYLPHSATFMATKDGSTELPIAIFNELKAYFAGKSWRLHHIRHWYRSCADFGSQAFSPEVAFELDEKVIGGNKKGHAVLSLDPDEGPLVDLEIMALLNALKDQRRRNSLPLDCSAALWLCIALGSNPFQMTLLREGDIEVIAEGDTRFVQLRVPE